MAEALQALLDLFAKLEPGIAAVILALLGRLKDSIAAESDQAIFLHVAGQVVVSFASDTLLTNAEKRVGGREAILNTLSDLAAFNINPPALSLVDELLMQTFPD